MFPFQIFMPLVKLWFICLQGQFPILRTKSSPDLYPLIRPLGRPLAFGIGRIFIVGFIRSPPTLAVYDVAHSLPQGDVGRGFHYTEDKTRRHLSLLSGALNVQLSKFSMMLCMHRSHQLLQEFSPTGIKLTPHLLNTNENMPKIYPISKVNIENLVFSLAICRPQLLILQRERELETRSRIMIQVRILFL